jgi:hypothetical protein
MIVDLGTDGFNRFQQQDYRSEDEVKTRGEDVSRLRELEAEHAKSHREGAMRVDGLVGAFELIDGMVELRFPDNERAYVEDAKILGCRVED